MAIESPRPCSGAPRRSSSGSPTISSIAYGCAKAFRELGADLAITYLNEKRADSWSR